VVAELEAGLISAGTKAALAEAMKRGVIARQPATPGRPPRDQCIRAAAMASASVHPFETVFSASALMRALTRVSSVV
jgi:hypothetical protein